MTAPEPETPENPKGPLSESVEPKTEVGPDSDKTETVDGGAKHAKVDQGKGRKAKPAKKKLPFWAELPILVVIALVLAFLIQTFLARVYVIPSESMEMTLVGCNGCTDDHVLVDKLVYRFGQPAPGDVIVFKAPDNWDKSEFQVERSSNPVLHFLQDVGSYFGLTQPAEYDLIKRVIAVGGQTVSCCNAQNQVMVNGKPLNESYIYWRPDYPAKQPPFGPVTVPAGELWVMGDNRNNSDDSRFQGRGDLLAGAVPVSNVIGKARFIVLPPNRWGGVVTKDPQAEALSAPAWQSGIPLGAGAVAAVPTLWAGKRLRRAFHAIRTKKIRAKKTR